MRMRRLLFIVAILVAFLNPLGVSLAQDSGSFEAGIEMSDGSQLAGQLLSIDGDVASFQIDGNEQTFSVKSIDQIRFSDQRDSPIKTSKFISLVDGSRLVCTSVKVNKRKLQATTETGVEFEANSRLIDFVRFASVTSGLEESWQDAINQERESDGLIVARDQKLQTVDGIISDVTADKVTFTVGERTAEVQRSRLSGLIFYRRVTDAFAPALCVLELNDGSSIQVRSISINDQTLEVSSVAGVSVSVKSDAVATIDFGANRSVWLTELDPANHDWVPLIAGRTILGSLKQFSIARIDSSFAGKALAVLTNDEAGADSVHRKEYAKGFAIKGGGKLSFRLAKQYRRLTGLIAFDPDANATGKVKLIVQIDGKNRIEEVLDASTLQSPFEVDIELSGADRIVFQVDYHDRRSVGDILHAVEMKLHR